jgi:hypothetical protein
MSQIFPRSANAVARASLFIVLATVALLGWLVMLLMRSDFVTGANANIEQPVQFSHAHHVGGEGIDCRYCHTSVEQSSFANIPPTKTCMNCHSQIWLNASYLEPVRESFRTNRSIEWIRVHDLPDFVYFNHSIHVKKGVGCETCHGRIDQMPLTYKVNTLYMQWCVECHRDPAKYIRPRDQVFNMAYQYPADQDQLGPQLVKDYKVQSLTDCVTCHR